MTTEAAHRKMLARLAQHLGTTHGLSIVDSLDHFCLEFELGKYAKPDKVFPNADILAAAWSTFKPEASVTPDIMMPSEAEQAKSLSLKLQHKIRPPEPEVEELAEVADVPLGSRMISTSTYKRKGKVEKKRAAVAVALESLIHDGLFIKVFVCPPSSQLMEMETTAMRHARSLQASISRRLRTAYARTVQRCIVRLTDDDTCVVLVCCPKHLRKEEVKDLAIDAVQIMIDEEKKINDLVEESSNTEYPNPIDLEGEELSDDATR